MKEIVCFAYIEVSSEPDDAPDKEQRLQALHKVMADTFRYPEEKIGKTLAKLDVTNINSRELAAEIKKGCER